MARDQLESLFCFERERLGKSNHADSPGSLNILKVYLSTSLENIEMNE
jgi:transposase